VTGDRSTPGNHERLSRAARRPRMASSSAPEFASTSRGCERQSRAVGVGVGVGGSGVTHGTARPRAVGNGIGRSGITRGTAGPRAVDIVRSGVTHGTAGARRRRQPVGRHPRNGGAAPSASSVWRHPTERQGRAVGIVGSGVTHRVGAKSADRAPRPALPLPRHPVRRKRILPSFTPEGRGQLCLPGPRGRGIAGQRVEHWAGLRSLTFDLGCHPAQPHRPHRPLSQTGRNPSSRPSPRPPPAAPPAQTRRRA